MIKQRTELEALRSCQRASADLIGFWLANRDRHHPEQAAFVDEAINRGDGVLAIHIIPKGPIAQLLFVDNQGGTLELTTLVNEQPDAPPQE